MGLSTRDFAWKSLARPGARVPAKGSKCGQGGEVGSPLKLCQLAPPPSLQRLPSYSVTELDQAGPTSQ